MLLRAVPLALLLAWLAYESHFSPSFFAAQVHISLQAMAGGLDDVLTGDFNVRGKQVAAQTE